MVNFDKNVFVNCPFDNDYRQLLLALIFTIKYFGLTPRLALERSDSGETRISKILELINKSKYGIHDLSRIISSTENEHYRMNMPFELGIDYGCQRLRGEQWANKKLLVLEKEKYRYQAALSDLSGSDIRHHGNEPINLVKVVRNWFVTEVFGTGSSHKKVWYDFNDFMADLETNLSELGHEEDDLNDVPIPEIMHYMDKWFSRDLP